MYDIPDSFVTANYTYYRNGKLKSETDSAGRCTDYFYDGNGNLTEKDVYTTITNKNVIEYTYIQSIR